MFYRPGLRRKQIAQKIVALHSKGMSKRSRSRNSNGIKRYNKAVKAVMFETYHWCILSRH
jgi:hypothetical protein